MELVADALLSLSECLPSSSNEGSTFESFRPAVREFYQIEEAKIYRRRLCDLIEKERKSKGNTNEGRLRVFREKKLEEIGKKIDAIVKEKKTEIDLKLSFEISLMSESFRQELWLRIQVCWFLKKRLSETNLSIAAMAAIKIDISFKNMNISCFLFMF